MSNEHDDDEWDFKVENVKTEQENVERKRRKERLAEKIGSKVEEKPRDAKKDLLGAGSKNIGLSEAPSSGRKSRARLAEEMRKADMPDFVDLMASPIKRLIAGAIDGAILFAVIFATDMYWEKIELHILEYLRNNKIDQPLDPATFKMYLMIFIGVLAYYIILAIPSVLSGRSWGKIFTNLSVQSSDEDKDFGFSARIFRELIAKPISLLTVVGPLFMFFNDEYRGLQDLVSGSCVMDDSIETGKKKKKSK